MSASHQTRRYRTLKIAVYFTRSRTAISYFSELNVLFYCHSTDVGCFATMIIQRLVLRKQRRYFNATDGLIIL